MLQSKFFSERVQYHDPTTGIKVIQLTNYPSPAAHFPYDWPSITPDNHYILLYAQRWTQRNAPWDIFRVEADGLNLFQLTEYGDQAADAGYYGRPRATLTHDGRHVYVLWADRLHRIDVETGADEELLSLEEYATPGSFFGRMCLDSTGKTMFLSRWGTSTTLRIRLDSGAIDQIELGGIVLGCFQNDDRLEVLRNTGQVEPVTQADGSRVFQNVNATPSSVWSIRPDGTDAQFLSRIDQFGHHTILGQTGLLQGTGQPPHRCIWIVEAGKEPHKLVEGPYFWHSGASFNGEWIVADTNWPDQGIQLIHVPTRHFRTLCHARATQDHVEYGHPHPTISPDGKLVVFRSDRTGVSQVYVAYVTEEFRESVIAGELDRPRDKWI